jgi:hypothetical protein
MNLNWVKNFVINKEGVNLRVWWLLMSRNKEWDIFWSIRELMKAILEKNVEIISDHIILFIAEIICLGITRDFHSKSIGSNALTSRKLSRSFLGGKLFYWYAFISQKKSTSYNLYASIWSYLYYLELVVDKLMKLIVSKS